MPSNLLQATDLKQLIIDCGATSHATGEKSDFVEGSLKELEIPVYMDGIAGQLAATHEGLLHYEFLSDNGNKEILEDQGYLMPELPCRLFSPQSYMGNIAVELDDPDTINMTIYHNRALLQLKSGNKVTIPYDPSTHLPVMSTYSDLEGEAKKLSGYKGCLTDETNQNLTEPQKTLLRWHYRLGHLGMKTVQWIARQGWLDSLGHKWGSTTVKAPRCTACLFGKQERSHKAGSRQKKHDPGSLKKEMLEPGDLVFSDQYESRLEGKIFTYKGASIKSDTYKGGTLYCDAASGYMYVHHQTSFTAEETVLSKLKFEREALGV